MQIGKKIQKWVWVFLVGSLVLILALPGSATASPTINYSLSLPLTCNQCKFLPPPQIGQEILNPDFESGATGWTFYVSTGNPILNNYQAHSPAHSAELGIYIDPNNPEPSYTRTAYIQQRVFVPTTKPLLQFYEYINSQEQAVDPGVCNQAEILGDWVRISVNNIVYQQVSLCDALNSTGWTLRQLNLSGYANRWVTLKVQFTSDSTLSSDYYVDDFSFVAAP